MPTSASKRIYSDPSYAHTVERHGFFFFFPNTRDLIQRFFRCKTFAKGGDFSVRGRYRRNMPDAIVGVQRSLSSDVKISLALRDGFGI